MLNILMMVTWYASVGDNESKAGIFHYEMSVNLLKHCNVALYFPFDTKMQNSFEQNVENGLLTFRSKRNSRERIKNKLRIFFDFIKIRKAFKPDILHAHVALGAGRYAYALGKIFRIPVVITEHMPIELSGLDIRKYRLMAKYVYQSSKFNACVSPDQMRRLQVFFPKAEFEVVYNGVIAPTLDHQDHKYFVAGYTNFAIVANLYDREIKGYQFLLPAIRILKEKGYAIRLHLIGGGEYLDFYKKMAADLGILDTCIFYGACEKHILYEIISEMAFCISASLFEASGVYVQEAMMLGKPLVVTNSGGADSLVSDKTAIVVEKASTEALTDGIEKMMKDLSHFDTTEIQDYGYSHFEINSISEKYMQVYTNIKRNKR